MENVKKCLEELLGDEFNFQMVGDDLELTSAKHNSIFGIDIKHIVDVIRVYRKNMYIDAEIKKGVYIRIY